MMTFECWLASRASNLITVITGGIQLALTGLSDPHHSYTRTITLVNIFVFLCFCICVFVYFLYLRFWHMGISFLTSLKNLLFRNIPHGGYFLAICHMLYLCVCVFLYFCICVFVWSSPHHYTSQNFRILYLCFCIWWILATDTPAILDL